MAPKQNLTALKTLVISMGFVLLGGTVLLAAIVWKKVAAETASGASAPACPGGQVDLKGRGAIVDSVVDGKIMRVTLEKHEGSNETVMIDMCSGKVIGALTILSDAAVIDE